VDPQTTETAVVHVQSPASLPGVSELVRLAFGAANGGTESQEFQALKLLGMTPKEAIDRAQGRDVVVTASTGRRNSTRTGGIPSFGNQVAIFSKNSRRPIKVQSRQTEHGRLKTARLGLNDVRVALAIWHSEERVAWPPGPIKLDGSEQGTPAQLFLAQSKLYLKYLKWDVRSSEQQQRILHSQNKNQKATHGGRFRVTELPSLDALIQAHPGLEKQLQGRSNYNKLYRNRT